MAREDARQYWKEQLTEYWESGFSIPEYCELKELSYESARRWGRIFEKERNAASGEEEEVIELVEIKPPRTVFDPKNSVVRLKVGLVNILDYAIGTHAERRIF